MKASVSTLCRFLLILLLNSNGIVHGQLHFRSLFDPWADRLNSFVRSFRKLELDSLYFKFPFEDKNISRVQFHLYTDKNPSRSQQLLLNDSSNIENSNFHKDSPVKILIHGYSQSEGSSDFPQQIKDAYIQAGNDSVNVICVDWSVLSKEINYFDSVNYTLAVGAHIGEFILNLKEFGFIQTFENVNLVGFSLGAHVSGIVGHYVAERTGNMDVIGRITGLDPAQPGFISVHDMHRLDSQDARFVDVIHTNMGDILFGDLGTTSNCGHADFFPNGGRRQPSCEYSMFREYSIPRRSTCSHVKAAEYFKKSILGERYVGCACKDWDTFQKGPSCHCNGDNAQDEVVVLMGEYCDHRARGEFYLTTN